MSEDDPDVWPECDPQPPLPDVTGWLREWGAGRAEALSEVFPALYAELHRIAIREMRRERPDHTLEATALLHEAYLNLREVSSIEWKNRAHFLAFAAHLMRRVLILHARRRGRLKAGGEWRKVTLAEAVEVGFVQPPDILALNDALETLEQLDPRKAAVVEMRFFGGFSMEETGQILEVSVETVGREWRKAKSWLLDFMTSAAEMPHEA